MQYLLAVFSAPSPVPGPHAISYPPQALCQPLLLKHSLCPGVCACRLEKVS